MNTTLHLPIQLSDLLRAIAALPSTEQRQIFSYLHTQLSLKEVEARLNRDKPDPETLAIHSVTTNDGMSWAVLSLPALQRLSQVPCDIGQNTVPPSLPQESTAELLSVLAAVKQEMLTERLALVPVSAVDQDE